VLEIEKIYVLSMIYLNIACRTKT